MEKAGVKRLLVVGGAGSLEVAPGVELVDTPQFPENIRPGAQAVRDLRNKLRNGSPLDWTYLPLRRCWSPANAPASSASAPPSY